MPERTAKAGISSPVVCRFSNFLQKFLAFFSARKKNCPIRKMPTESCSEAPTKFFRPQTALFRTLFVLFACAALSGCATYVDETRNAREKWNAGKFGEASALFSKLAEENSDTGDALVWRLEEGASARAAGDLKKSLEAFEKAYENSEQYTSEISISEETAAILTNQSFISYKGRPYEKIMLCAYQALNEMELKNFESAAVWLRRMENKQADAERENEEKIRDSNAAIKQAKKENKNANCDTEKTILNSVEKFEKFYGKGFLSPVQKTRGLYVNPFAYWLAGLYYLNAAYDNSDRQKASDFFRLGSEMVDIPIFKEDFKRAEEAANGGSPAPVSYVVYEEDIAPARDQFKLDLPLYLINESIPHVSMNFPYLRPLLSKTPDPSVKVGKNFPRFYIVANMDSIISEDFRNELPSIITKTLISSAVKAGTQAALASAAGGGWESLAVIIAGSVYQIMTNDADLRSWSTLPKRIKIARFSTPPDGKIFINQREIYLKPGAVNVVLLKSVFGKFGEIRRFDFDKKETE